MLIRSALFWDIMHRRVAILYRRFGTTYRYHLQRSRSPRRLPDPWRGHEFMTCVGKVVFLLLCSYAVANRVVKFDKPIWCVNRRYCVTSVPVRCVQVHTAYQCVVCKSPTRHVTVQVHRRLLVNFRYCTDFQLLHCNDDWVLEATSNKFVTMSVTVAEKRENSKQPTANSQQGKQRTNFLFINTVQEADIIRSFLKMLRLNKLKY